MNQTRRLPTIATLLLVIAMTIILACGSESPTTERGTPAPPAAENTDIKTTPDSPNNAETAVHSRDRRYGTKDLRDHGLADNEQNTVADGGRSYRTEATNPRKNGNNGSLHRRGQPAVHARPPGRSHGDTPPGPHPGNWRHLLTDTQAVKQKPSWKR